MAGVRTFRGSRFEVRGSEKTTRAFWIAVTFCLVLSTLSGAQDSYQKIRKPVFAGSFYPSDRATLEKVVDAYLKEAGAGGAKLTPHIFGLIEPHAGYEYSGKVAAHGYSQIKGKEYSTVILMGSSHRIPFKGIAVYSGGAWETPLGRVAIDGEILKNLMDRCKAVKVFAPAFEKEHSLEVQVPFLQRTLRDFRIVPLVLGSMDGNDYRALSEALYSIVKGSKKSILIIASSDMSHYHDYSKASGMDNGTLKEIEDLNIEKLYENIRNGRSELCGAQGAITLMMVAKKAGADVRILNYANSGDVTQDKGRVVGYSAVAFSLTDSESHALNAREQSALLTMARKTLNEYVATKTLPRFDIADGRLLEKRGVFVTLNKKGNLRGCIGYIMPVVPLHRAVCDMTVNAAAKDPRFPPVSKEELKEIEIELSVLSPLKPVANINEILVGTHGLYIVRGNSAGLLLPQVAAAYKWTREEFLAHTCRKAGLPDVAWKENGTQVYSFSAQIWSEGRGH